MTDDGKDHLLRTAAASFDGIARDLAGVLEWPLVAGALVRSAVVLIESRASRVESVANLRRWADELERLPVAAKPVLN